MQCAPKKTLSTGRLNESVAALAMLASLAGCGGKSLTVQIIPPLVRPSHVSPAAPPAAAILFHETFDRLDPSQWREVEVNGKTHFAIHTLERGKVLKAHSRPGASILLHSFRFDPDTFEWLSWAWRVDRFVEKEDLRRKDGSDAPARVYVYFKTAGLPWQKRNIDYVWSRTLPVGTILDSAYSGASKIVVVDSGVEHQGEWRAVSRNIEDDYRMCFGDADPPDVLAIGLMADADNTRSEALAYFDDVAVSREPPEPR